MQLLAFLTLGALAAASPFSRSYTLNLRQTNATGIEECGDAGYRPSEYTCFDGKLCPINNGRPTQPCGAHCYDPSQYNCQNGTLYSGIFFNGTATSSTGVSGTAFPTATGVSFRLH